MLCQLAYAEIPLPSNFMSNGPEVELVEDLKGRSKATDLTLGRLWLLNMMSKKVQRCPEDPSLSLLCVSSLSFQFLVLPTLSPPSDTSLWTHRAGGYIHTIAFHRYLSEFLLHGSISMAGSTRLLRFPYKFGLIHLS